MCAISFWSSFALNEIHSVCSDNQFAALLLLVDIITIKSESSIGVCECEWWTSDDDRRNAWPSHTDGGHWTTQTGRHSFIPIMSSLVVLFQRNILFVSLTRYGRWDMGAITIIMNWLGNAFEFYSVAFVSSQQRIDVIVHTENVSARMPCKWKTNSRRVQPRH